jgi:hypothetical protein
MTGPERKRSRIKEARPMLSEFMTDRDLTMLSLAPSHFVDGLIAGVTGVALDVPFSELIPPRALSRKARR